MPEIFELEGSGVIVRMAGAVIELHPGPTLITIDPALVDALDPVALDPDQDVVPGAEGNALDDDRPDPHVGDPAVFVAHRPEIRSKAFWRVPAPVPKVLATQLLVSFRVVRSLSMNSVTPRNTSSWVIP